MSTPIELIPGDLGTGYCPATYQELYERMFDLGSASVQINGLVPIFGSTEPAAADRDKPWIKLNVDGSLDGIFVWFNGAWTAALPDRAMIAETYGSGVGPPIPVSGSWQARQLNTLQFSSIAGLSLAANQITLPAGTYLFRAHAPAFGCGTHQVRLADVDAPAQYYGSSEYAPGSFQIASNRSFVQMRVTIGGSHKFELQHYVQALAATPAGTWGVANTFGGSNVFAMLEVEKET